MKLKWIALRLVATAFWAGQAQAVLITVGGDQTAGTGFITLLNDVTFTITTTPTAKGPLFVFDEIVSIYDTIRDQLDFSGLTFSVNGGSPQALNRWADNLGFNAGSITAKDGYLVGSTGFLTLGDTVVLHAGTGTMTGTIDSTFNAWSSGDYTLFLADGNARQISDSIPEPTVLILLSVFGTALMRGRHFGVI